MIQIEVNVAATFVVNPENWDTAAHLTNTIDKAIADVCKFYGHSVNVKVTAELAAEPPF